MPTIHRMLLVLMLNTGIFTDLLKASDEPPLPFLSEVAGKYTGTVKIINWGPDSGDGDSEYAGMVAALRALKGQSFPVIFEIKDDNRFKGRVTWRTEELTISIPFDYDPVGGRMTLDAPVPELQGIHAKVDCAARMIARYNRYAVQVSGTIYLNSPRGQDEGWMNIAIRASCNDVLERVTPPPKPKPAPYVPAYDKRTDTGIRFSDISGQVEVFHYDYSKHDWSEDGEVAKIGSFIYADDKVVTGEESEAVLSFPDWTTYHMRSETAVVLSERPDRGGKLSLLGGDILVNLMKMIRDGEMDLQMSQAVLGIKGTVFVCRETGTESEVRLLQGKLEFRHRTNGKVLVLKPGQSVVATAEGFSPIREFDIAKERSNWPTSSTSPTVPKDVPGIPHPPETPSENNPRPAPKVLQGPYLHPSGEFRFNTTSGWGIIPNFRNKISDPNTETLIDESQQLIITIVKQVKEVSEPRTAFARWLAYLSRSLEESGIKGGLRVDQLNLGGEKGWRVSYRIEQPLVISRIFVAHAGHWYTLNVVAPLEYGQAELPAPVLQVFQSLEFLTPTRPQESLLLGKELLSVENLDRLSTDFSLTAYEQAIVIRDKIHGLEQNVRAGTENYHPQENVVTLFKDDPASLRLLGRAKTPAVSVFDYRFEVQLFENGIAVHEPVTSYVWVKSFD